MNKLIEQLSVLYGEPNTPNPEAFIAAYDNATGNADDETLIDAANLIARRRTVSAWPTIAECLDAIADSRKLAKSRGMNLEPINDWDTWFGGLIAQIMHADKQSQIDEAVNKVAPYCRAHWCHPNKAEELRKFGAERMAKLKAARARNPAGGADA